jgi:hypothetical protein
MRSFDPTRRPTTTAAAVMTPLKTTGTATARMSGLARPSLRARRVRRISGSSFMKCAKAGGSAALRAANSRGRSAFSPIAASSWPAAVRRVGRGWLVSTIDTRRWGAEDVAPAWST